MTGNTKMPIARRLAEWSAGVKLADVPSEVRHAAKRCIIDTIGVALAGSRLPVAERIAGHARDQYGDGRCTVLGRGQGATTAGAAFANGTAAHALDFDDTSYAGIIHGSTIVLPASLAAAEHAGCEGADFLEAFIAGSEATYALGLTLTDSHYLSGWWATGTLGAIGGAAGAAKALGLDEDETAAAIAFAAIQANGMIAMLGYDAKPVLAGQAARLGAESALLAAHGHTTPEQAFEDRRGMLNLMNKGKSDPAGLAELGARWRLVDPGIAVKVAPLCSATQAAIEIAQALIDAHDLDRQQISRVRCEVPNLVKISLPYDRPETPPEAQFSMPFAIGCVLAFGSLGPEHISQDVLAEPALLAAMEKVEMVEADDLNGPDYQPHFPECARVIIEMADGTKVTDFRGTPTGAAESPMSDDALAMKFRTCAAFAGWNDDRIDTTLAGLWDIETAPGLGELIRGEATCATP